MKERTLKSCREYAKEVMKKGNVLNTWNIVCYITGYEPNLKIKEVMNIVETLINENLIIHA